MTWRGGSIWYGLHTHRIWSLLISGGGAYETHEAWASPEIKAMRLSLTYFWIEYSYFFITTIWYVRYIIYSDACLTHWFHNEIQLFLTYFLSILYCTNPTHTHIYIYIYKEKTDSIDLKSLCLTFASKNEQRKLLFGAF